MNKISGPGGSYVIADDASLGIPSNKINLQGIYTGDIVIPAEGLPVTQLVFFLHIFFNLEQEIVNISAKVWLPGRDAPYIQPLPDAPPLGFVPKDRTMRFLKFPFPIVGPVLFSGRIKVAIDFNGAEVELYPSWIITAEENQRRIVASVNASNAFQRPS